MTMAFHPRSHSTQPCRLPRGRYRCPWSLPLGAVCTALVLARSTSSEAAAPLFELQRQHAQGQLTVMIEGKEAFGYQYATNVDLPHFFPLRSPSGRSTTVQQTDPYPHHRSFWFADTVEFQGRSISFYNALYSRVDPKDLQSPFKDRIRHVRFLPENVSGKSLQLGMELVWESDLGKTPVLTEVRRLRCAALGSGGTSLT